MTLQGKPDERTAAIPHGIATAFFCPPGVSFVHRNGQGGLRMTVYADEAFLLNAAVDYLLLICGAKLGGGRLLRLRFALAAALGGLYAAAALSPRLAFLQALPVKLASLAAMLLLAYGVGRHTLRAGLLFLAAVCAFGGMALAAAQIFGTGVLVLPGGTYYAVSLLGLLLLAGLAYLLCYTVFACTARHGGGEIVPLRLTYGAASVPIRALRDTGCTLCDPVTGERALVAEAGALQALLPGAAIRPAELRDPAALLLRLHTQDPQLPLRLLSYRSVGTQAGLLLALRCETIAANGRRRSCLAAFSPTPVSDGGNYDALTGGDG